MGVCAQACPLLTSKTLTRKGDYQRALKSYPYIFDLNSIIPKCLENIFYL